MDKVVIRTKIIFAISSRIIEEFHGEKTLIEIAETNGCEYVLKNIFDEEELNYEQLNNEYENFIKGKESRFFSWMYIIKSGFGIVLDANIHLYHYNSDMSAQQNKLFKWEYMETKKFLGDTWWFSDEEILKDMQQLNILDFLEKYKGYY